MAVGDPVLAQHQQRTFRQRHVAILAALAVPHVDEHPVTVNVWHLQANTFLQAQTAGVDCAQADAVAWETEAAQDALHFVHAEHDGQGVFAGGANPTCRVHAVLGGLPFAADPSAYFFCIQPILFTELFGKIVFFWRDQNVMASNNGW